jgi:conjugative transfer signal peptidase TraF
MAFEKELEMTRGATAIMRRMAIALLTAFALATLAWSAFGTHGPRLVYNASDSVPMGWYRIRHADSLTVGNIVLARLPAAWAEFAERRGYLPARIPILKRIGAVAPQQVCIRGRIVHVDGVLAGAALPHDRLGRSMPAWEVCRRLAGDELFLLSNDNPASFDSRYFGPISSSTVVGLAEPIWVDGAP